MPKYAHIETGFALDPIERASLNGYLALFANSVIMSWEIVEVPDQVQHGAKCEANGTYTNPIAPPNVSPLIKPSISRRRFDDVFATAIGELAYATILQALADIAATNPMTEQSAQMKRALRALDAPGEIDYPLGDWKVSPVEGDLTAKFLLIVIQECTPTIPDIAAKIDAGLAAWPSV